MTNDVREAFLSLSSILTGYSKFRLSGTGQSDNYFAATCEAVGADVVAELVAAFGEVQGEAAGDESVLDRGMRLRILSDDKLGPITRNITKMWFVGTWYELPQEWRDLYATGEAVSTHVVSPGSYTEGLLWPTIGANPPGAKGQGFASWTGPPTIEEV